jgi:hypothetical protein
MPAPEGMPRTPSGLGHHALPQTGATRMNTAIAA